MAQPYVVVLFLVPLKLLDRRKQLFLLLKYLLLIEFSSSSSAPVIMDTASQHICSNTVSLLISTNEGGTQL